MREPSEVRRDGNRLSGEGSLYLRQHAHNPVDWFPWGDEVLRLARELNRPIFLSVGYASCHWCHVMEREVFESEEAARLLNEHYLCIKVDREERPDLDTAYMQALIALTGRGGWPMSLFLTPDLQPFFAATYLPQEAFLHLAEQLHQLYRDEGAAITAQSATLRRLLTPPADQSPPREVNEAMLDRTTAEILAHHDGRWGGLRGPMKFPTPALWHFLLHRYRRTGEAGLARALTRTLDAMAAGGIHDHLSGGFHRYTVEETWRVPHFEKMLYDNALLAGLYLEASVALEVPRYATVARRTLDFLLEEMVTPEGGLCASLDADSAGSEGSFYLWTPEEIDEVAGPRDGPPLAALLGVSREGELEGRSVLALATDAAEVAARFERSPTEMAALIERWRPRLLERRHQRPGPDLDRKVVASWNGLAISALAHGASLLAEDRYRQAAERAAAFLWERHRLSDGRLQRTSTGKPAPGEGVLGDYANLAVGLLDLFGVTMDPRHLRWAIELVGIIEERFAGPTGYFLTPQGQEAPLGRQIDLLDNVRPSGSAATLHALIRLGLLHHPRHLERARAVLAAQGSRLHRAGLEMAWGLDAAQLLPTMTSVIIAGDPDGADTRALVRAVRDCHPGHAQLLLLPAAGPAEELRQLAPVAAGRAARGGAATAFLCGLDACSAPTGDPAPLRAMLLQGWHC